MKVEELSIDELAARLNRDGISLQLGTYRFRIQSDIPLIAEAIHVLYGGHPLHSVWDFSDFRLRLDAGRLRGRSMIVASVNGQYCQMWRQRLTVAAMEWVISWCFFRGAYNKLSLHSAVALRPGTETGCLLFPGNSGAGKSTLASTLMMCDWRLLSDEIAVIDVETLQVTGLGRPTILKGHSLALIKDRYGDRAIFGPTGRVIDPPTDIAHLRQTTASLEINNCACAPEAILFPCRTVGAKFRLEPVREGETFALLSQFGINYRVLGKRGFKTGLELVRQCPAYRMHYEDAADAEACLRDERFLASKSSKLSTAKPNTNGSAAIDSKHPANLSTEDSVPSTRPTTAPFRGPSHAESSWQMLVHALREPSALFQWTVSQWDEFYPFANHAECVPQIVVSIKNDPRWFDLPERIRNRLEHDLRRYEFNRCNIEFELMQLQRSVPSLASEIVLLKGAAYAHAQFPWAAGRTTNDVDVLVSEKHLDTLENALRGEGYQTKEALSDADCRYFRRWLHEIPPLHHAYRRIEVDIHFRLLPVLDPASFSVEPLLQRAITIPGRIFRMLDAVDQVIHAILNLARTGEFRRALRDFWDLRGLVGADLSCTKNSLEPYASESESSPHRVFDWETLIERSKELRIEKPIATVLVLADDLMGIGLPDEVAERLLKRTKDRIRSSWYYRTMRCAAIPSGPNFRSQARRRAMWMLEHYPLPRLQTWFDPLTWTKRVRFSKDD